MWMNVALYYQHFPVTGCSLYGPVLIGIVVELAIDKTVSYP